MRRDKYSRIGIALTICALALLLAGEAGLISDALAAKPDKPPGQDKPPAELDPVYGYLLFRDAPGDKILSDNETPYVDCTKGGEDFIEIILYSDYTLKAVYPYCGKMIWHHPGYDPSLRRVNFNFDIHGGMPTPECADNQAVYDMLGWYGSAISPIQRSIDEQYGYLNDGSVHAPFRVSATSTDRVQFVVDPGFEGLKPIAITQATVDAYDETDSDPNYWDTSERGYDELGQIIYTLRYGVDGIGIQEVGWDENGHPITWVFETAARAEDDPVELTVGRYGGKVSKGANKITPLATYSELPFAFAISLEPLITWDDLPDAISFAPAKHRTLSTTWGKIKSKL